MSIANLTANSFHAQIGAGRTGANALQQGGVGQVVTVRIVDKIADGRYTANINSGRYVVASELPLESGQILRASISAVGGMVELKYLGPGQTSLEQELIEVDGVSVDGSNEPIAALQSQFKVKLSPHEEQVVVAHAREFGNPAMTTQSAAFLHKVGEAVEEAQLNAVYHANLWPADRSKSSTVADLAALLKGVQQGNEADIGTLARSLADVFEAAGTPSDGLAIADSTASAGDSANLHSDASRGEDEQESMRALALRLLNAQDSGALAYHYGTMPMMIGGQMMELDMVMFREREASRGHRQQGLRKLVMTFRTETLGRVEIVAQSLDTVLSVAIGTQSPQVAEALASHAQEVRDLVGRLGWQVDSVSYRLSTEPQRAAEQLIRHVVNSGSLDALV